MNKKYFITILLLLILAVAVNIFSQDNKTELFSGKLKSIGGEWYINTGEDFFKLNLAPEDFLSENKIILESKSEIIIHGKLAEEEIIAYKLIYNEQTLEMRTDNGKTLWKEEGKGHYVVNPKKCIGCRLCVKPCPTDAITMVKGRAVIDADKCIACGICADGDGKNFKGCPTSAIDKATE